MARRIIRNPHPYGTAAYFEHREKVLAKRQRGYALAARGGSKKAAQGARKTGRTLEKVREDKLLAERIDRTGTPGHVRHIIRTFDQLPATERRKIDELLREYGSRPVPGNIDTGLSKTGWWLFFRSGGATG